MQTSNENRSDGPANEVVLGYIRNLDEKYRMLVVLKSQLYGGSWQPMLEDLHNRLNGKPYIFKLANRIKDDVERIKQMRIFEREQGIDLADYIRLE